MNGGVPWARGGYLGISTFFTLSGFLISTMLLAELDATKGIALASFWERRLRRLLPAALLALALSGVLVGLVAEPTSFGLVRDDVLSALLWVANWRFVQTGQSYLRVLTEPSPVQHFWSLAVEMQFYLLFPLLLLLLARARLLSSERLLSILGLLAAASAGLAGFLQLNGAGFSRAYYGTDTRAAELLVGAMFGVWFARRGGVQGRAFVLPLDKQLSKDMLGGESRVVTLLGAFALAALMASWALVPEGASWFFGGGQLAYAMLTLGLLRAAIGGGLIARLLSLTPLRRLGRVSYGLYLFHWPIFIWLNSARTGLSGSALLGLRLLVTGLVAGGVYVLLEERVRRDRLLRGWRIWAAAGAGTAVVALLHISLAGGLAEPGLLETADSGAESSPIAGGDAPVLLVVGDSVARNLAQGLLAWGREHGVRVVDAAMVGCGIASPGVRRFPVEIGKNELCEDRIDFWKATIEREHPDAVVVLPGVWDLVERRLGTASDFSGPGDPVFDTWLTAEYTTATNILASDGREVFWLTFPCVEQKAWPGLLGESAALQSVTIAHLNEQILPALLSRRANLTALLPLAEKVCPGGGFSHQVGEAGVFRPDGLHFRGPDARWVAEWLGPEILNRLARENKS